MLAGCLGLIILFVFIGFISKTFGEGWGILTFVIFLGLGIWSSYQEKKKSKQATSEEQPAIIPPKISNVENQINNQSNSITPLIDSQTTALEDTPEFLKKQLQYVREQRDLIQKELDKQIEINQSIKNELRFYKKEYKKLKDIQFYRDLGTIHAETPKQSNKFIKNNALTFCFTGFKKEEKEHFIQVAKDNGLRVVQDVSRNVDFLVIDRTSRTIGPRKLERAKEYGVKVMDQEQFLDMLETGEIPS